MAGGYSEDHLKAIRSFGLSVGDLPLFVEMGGFWTRWREIGLTDADLYILQVTLALRPAIGDVVSGTNGVRKARFAAPGSGKGKSGAYRVFYLNLPEHEIVVLVGVLDKAEKGNLTKAHRNAIAAAVARIKAELDRRSQP